MKRNAFPIATVTVWVITAIITGSQAFYPEVLTALRRDPQALAAGQWWRLVTPFFVHAEGWLQVGFNLASMAVVGVLVERLFGSRRWLILYFVPGVIGEIAGYAWLPDSAGASVAVGGLLGSLLAYLLWTGDWRGAFGGIAGLLGSVALTAFRDLHGPPILAGAILAAIMLRRGITPRPLHNVYE